MGTLYLVATPIGNLEDLSARARTALAGAALVLAEDTRRTRVLLQRHGVAARPLSLHAHNEAARVEKVLAVLAGGGDVALVSDAGTPLISDPGERLVAAALGAGHAVSAVPGASAVLAALSVAGLPAVPFTFLGFLPRRAGARDALLERLRAAPETLVLFESPRRLGASLEHLARRLGERRACVARELTKRYEEVARGTLSELAERFRQGARGEVTIVVEGAPPALPDAGAADAEIRARLAGGESPRQIAAALAAAGHRRGRVYARAIALRGGGD